MKVKKVSAIPARMLLAIGVFGATLGGIGPFTSVGGAAWAQEDDGHEDGDNPGGGGHGGGEHGGGGHGDGGQHGNPVPPEITPSPIADDEGADPQARSAGPSGSGFYFRFELGAAQGSAGNANWPPPGFGGGDPQVFFDLDLDAAAMGTLAVGRDYGNGWRGELALNLFANSDFEGPWSYTVPDTTGPHADMAGSARSTAVLVSGYRDFDTGGRITPFVTAGIGLAHNEMGEWTRINPDASRTRRTFRGGSDTDLAWSVGAGVAVDVGEVMGSAPAKLEFAWRYFDLGSIKGGTEAVPGSGAGGSPVRALGFDLTEQVLSVGIRIAF